MLQFVASPGISNSITPAPPLVRSAPLGGFSLCGAQKLPKKPFAKPAISLDAQVQRLVDRGMLVSDRDSTRDYIQRIGYYRFSGYTLPFQNGGGGEDHHSFKEPTEFQTILDRYIFDRKLRLILLDAIERIEVSIRASLSNHIAERNSPHWYLERKLFVSKFDHTSYIQEIKRQIKHEYPDNRSVYINHYYTTYSAPPTPPSWMVFEDVSFGVVSRTVKNIIKPECKEICQQFETTQDILSSWLHAISYIRNLCAHHSRVWNRILTIKPVYPRKSKHLFPTNDKIYAVLVITQILLRKIAPDNHWVSRLADLLESYPEVPLLEMGIPEDWREINIWHDF